MPTLLSQMAREFRLLAGDRWLLALFGWLPPLLFLVMYAIFSAGLARDLPVAVVDLDNSRLSRRLVRTYDASPTLAVRQDFADVADGSNALRSGMVSALVVIPAKLEEDSLRGRSPQVTAFVNSQFLLIGRLVGSALQQAHASAVTAVDVFGILLKETPPVDRAVAIAAPIAGQVNPLFNAGMDYARFLVSAIVPALWQILIVAATVMALAAGRHDTRVDVRASSGSARAIACRILPGTLCFWCHGQLFLFGFFGLLDWPMHGSWLVLGLAQLLTVAACQCAGILLYLLTCDATRALSLVAAYTAPGLAFMGITFPVTDMNLPARIWRSLLPISHYIEIQVSQVNYGLPLPAVLPQFGALLLFLLLAAPITIRLRMLGSHRPAREDAR
jgi:ABC-2 type transport system permease protein